MGICGSEMCVFLWVSIISNYLDIVLSARFVLCLNEFGLVLFLVP